MVLPEGGYTFAPSEGVGQVIDQQGHEAYVVDVSIGGELIFDIITYKGPGENGQPVLFNPVTISGKLSIGGKPASNIPFGVEDPISMRSSGKTTDKDGLFEYKTEPVKSHGIYLFTFFYNGEPVDNLFVGVFPGPSDIKADSSNIKVTVEDSEFEIKLGQVGGAIKEDDFTAYIAVKTEKTKTELSYSKEFWDGIGNFIGSVIKNFKKNITSTKSITYFSFVGGVCATVGTVPTGVGQISCGGAVILGVAKVGVDSLVDSIIDLLPEEDKEPAKESIESYKKVKTILEADVIGLLGMMSEEVVKSIEDEDFEQVKITELEKEADGKIKNVTIEGRTKSGKTIVLNSGVAREGVTFIGKCPVDLIITSPSGKKISKDIKELEGQYFELDIDSDGDLDDIVMVFEPEGGDYSVEVIAEAGAKLEDTFSVEVDTGKEVKVLLEEQTISEIPSKPVAVKLEVSETGEIEVEIKPAKPKLPWDVNNDGMIDISDFVLVGSHFGEAGKGITGDINGDGTVDISDIVLVISHFGEVY
jgi:hypothetical protein